MPEKYIKAADCEKYFYEHLDDVHIAGAMNMEETGAYIEIIGNIHDNPELLR